MYGFSWKMLLFTAVLFYVLTPGVFLTLPPGASLMTVRVTHSVVFAVAHFLLKKQFHRLVGA